MIAQFLLHTLKIGSVPLADVHEHCCGALMAVASFMEVARSS